MRRVPPLALLLVLCQAARLTGGAGAVGVDVGGMNSVVAVARRGGVDVVANELSHRLTPSLVGFDGNARRRGESAASARAGSPSNVIAPRELLSQGAAHTAEAEVEYCGAKVRFTAVQLFAMLLRHLMDIADRDHGSALTEVVVAVPYYFSPSQRQAVIDATELAGARCLRLVSEGAAAALHYALSRSDLSADEERLVAFVDAGYSGVQACVAAVKRGELKVLANVHADGAGGKALDEILFSHFCSQIASSTSADVRSSPRACQRLLNACEKLRRILSANRDASVSLDCLVGDTDVTCSLTRSQLEEMAQPVIESADSVCKRLLGEAGIDSKQLHSVEVIGGLSRMPAIADAIGSALQHPLRRSLNADEAVARGAALAAAMTSKHFKAKPFRLVEAAGFPLRFGWRVLDGGSQGSASLRRGTVLPWRAEHEVQISPREKLHCECCEEADNDGTGGNSDALRSPLLRCLIACPSVSGGASLRLPSMLGWASGRASTAEMCVKLTTHVDEDGMPHITATMLAEAEKMANADKSIDPNKMSAASSVSDDTATVGGGETGVNTESFGPANELMDGNGSPGANEGNGDVAKDVTVATDEMPVSVTWELQLGLSADQIESLRAREVEMATRDAEIERTLAMKNSLEASLYTSRDALADQLAPYASEAEADTLREVINEVEDWLYTEGADVSRREYEAKAAAVADALAPIKERFRIFVEQSSFVVALRKRIEEAKALAKTAGDGELGTASDASKAQRHLTDSLNALRSATEAASAAAVALDAVLEGPRNGDGRQATAAVRAAAEASKAVDAAIAKVRAASKTVKDEIAEAAREVKAELAREAVAREEAQSQAATKEDEQATSKAVEESVEESQEECDVDDSGENCEPYDDEED